MRTKIYQAKNWEMIYIVQCDANQGLTRITALMDELTHGQETFHTCEEYGNLSNWTYDQIRRMYHNHHRDTLLGMNPTERINKQK